MPNVTVIEQAALTAEEGRTLDALESTIGTGMRSFVEVGNALAVIRDERLYRARYRTFEAYVADRWGWNRSAAYKYITAAEVQDNVSSQTQLPTLTHGMLLSAFSSEQQRTIAPKIATLTVRDATKVVQQFRDAETNTDAVSEEARREIREALASDDSSPAVDAFLTAVSTLALAMRTLPDDELTRVAGGILQLRDAYNATREARRG